MKISTLQAATLAAGSMALMACVGSTAPSTPPVANEIEVSPPTTTTASPTELPLASAEVAPAVETPPPAPAPSAPSAWQTLAPVTGCSRSATILVIDRSGSMSGLPIDMAKTGAKNALKSLDARDCFGVITFDSVPTRVVAIAPVTDRTRIEESISKITAGGGTEIGSALDSAAKDLFVVSGAKHRGVLLLTDGQSPQNGVRDLARAMATSGIVISTIGLGDGVDQPFLRMVADQANGRTTIVRDPNALPGAVVKEAALLAGLKP